MPQEETSKECTFTKPVITSFKTEFTPEQVDYDPSCIDKLNGHFERLIKEKQIQSANYCLSRYGKQFANTAIGNLSYDKADNRVLTPDSIHGIASITKIFCASAIFKLIEDGFIRGNQTVSTILKEFDTPPYNEITIAHLLSHTSGLHPDPGCFPNKYYRNPWECIRSFDKVPWLEAGLSIGTYNKPGVEWAYCSFGFVILGEVIHRVTGMEAEVFIEQNIFKPCKMDDSGFFTRLRRDFSEIQKWKSKFTERMYVQNPDEATDLKELFNMDSDIFSKKSAKDARLTEVPGTGGAMFSTAIDLNKFGVMLLNKGVTSDGVRVLSRKAVERMTENYTTNEIRDNCWGAKNTYRMYGLGPDTRRNADYLYSKGTYFHEGAGACDLIIDPVEGFVASWFVPFADYDWHAEALYNASNVMWSGIL